LVVSVLFALAAPAVFASHHEAGEGDDGAAKSADASAEASEPVDLPWDAEKMSTLTAQLSKEVRALRNAYRQSPNYANDQNPNRLSAQAMSDTLKSLDQSCASLAKRVKKGENAEQTRGLARSIGSLLNDVDQHSRQLMIGEWTQEKARPAMETINAIAPYYGRGPLYDVEDMTKLDRGPNPKHRKQGE
jgi:hypothetical protein